MKIFTIGHSTRTLETFTGLLQKAEVNKLADIRRFPRSRWQPHFNIETLPDALAAASIGYKHFEALGGKRPTIEDGKPSLHDLWRSGGGLQSYADYAETPPFREALTRLLTLTCDNVVAIMCAEANWRDCHRRIVTDYLLAAGAQVEHIITDKIESAQLTEGASIRPDGTILYSNQPPLFRVTTIR